MKKINQIDLKTGCVINTYDSIKKAAELIKGDESSISQCLNGKLKTSAGYRWVFCKTMEDHAKESGEVDTEEAESEA